MKQKSITRTYRNGKSAFQMDYVVRLKPNIAKTHFVVTEQRAQFKDEKTIFWGSEKDAEQVYDETTNVTITNGVSVRCTSFTGHS